jgi:hypothetical protein
MRREATYITGTRDEVLEALASDAQYHRSFGRLEFAQEADTATTCVVGGSNLVRVGHLMYEVQETS